jgi:hypothetical protein
MMRYFLIVEFEDGTFTVREDHPDVLRAYVPLPGETVRLLRRAA